jgi:hypothetical protein
VVKSRSAPEFVVRIHTYAELQSYAQAFANGNLSLLIVCGAAGLGKSQGLRSAVGEQACWIDGNATAFGVYLRAYECRDQPLVLDDVDGLCSDGNGIRLLKTLCQTDRVKTLCWQTDAKTLDRRGIPRQFTTTSRVAIVANEWRTTNANVAALEDRGHFLVFEPSALEVHRQASIWFWDQQIFDFVGDRLHLLERPSLRLYVLASELKRARLDWQQGILSRCLSGTALAVAKLKADPRFTSEDERIQSFVAAGSGSRSTYFNYARKLAAVTSRPEINLARTAPPATQAPKMPELPDLSPRQVTQPGIT